MKEYHFGDIRAEIDEEATRSYYAQAPVLGCTCEFDQNFVELAKRRKLPEDVLALLDKLSIPPEKAIHMEDYALPDETGFAYIHYRIAGRLLNEPEPVELWLPPKRKGFKKFTALLGLLLGSLLGRKPVLEKVLVPGTLEGELEGGALIECKAVTAAADFPGPCFDFAFLCWVSSALDETLEE